MKHGFKLLKTTIILIAVVLSFNACNNNTTSSTSSSFPNISIGSATEDSSDENSEYKPANKKNDEILSEAVPLSEIPYAPDAIAMDLSYYRYAMLAEKTFGEYTFTLVANTLNMQEDCYFARMKLIASMDGKALADEFIAAHSDGSQTGTILYKNDDTQDIMLVETMVQNGKEYPLVIVKYKCHPSYGENAVTLSRFFTIINNKGFTFHDTGFINYKNLSDNFTITDNILYDTENNKSLVFDFMTGKAEIKEITP